MNNPCPSEIGEKGEYESMSSVLVIDVCNSLVLETSIKYQETTH